MKLLATFNNLVLKPLERKTNKGLIALPDNAQGESDFCEVVSVGTDAEHFDVGDVVLRPSPAEYEYTDEEDNDQLYLIVPETSVVAKVA